MTLKILKWQFVSYNNDNNNKNKKNKCKNYKNNNTCDNVMEL